MAVQEALTMFSFFQNVLNSPASTVQHEIHTHGCLTIIEKRMVDLFAPSLLVYSVIATLLALLKVLTVVAACSKANHLNDRIAVPTSECGHCSRNPSVRGSPYPTPKAKNGRYGPPSSTSTETL